MVGIPIRGVDAFEALGELDVTYVLPTPVQHEAHAFAQGPAVVDVVVAVEVEHERPVGQDR